MPSNRKKPLKAQGSRLKAAASALSLQPSASSRKSLVVTIDGPAGVGKSTAAKLLAKQLGLLYLDTGATYRALAYAALRHGLHPLADARRLAELARRLPLRLREAGRGQLRFLLNGVDITTAIRTEEVSEAAAQISQHPGVRAAMVRRQRELAARGYAKPEPGRVAGVLRLGSGRRPEWNRMAGVVAEGRDTGSVVFPRAAYKFFLDADPAVRARRRQGELSRLYTSSPPLVQVQEQLRFRDRLDRNRRVGPLVKPRGAIELDTTRLTAEQVVRAMMSHMAAAGPWPTR